MEKSAKIEIIRKEGNRLLSPLQNLFIMILLAVLLSPLLLIWFGFELFTKSLLTMLLILIVDSIVIHFLKSGIKSVIKDVENEIEPTKSPVTKSKFQERLEKMAKERGFHIQSHPAQFGEKKEGE